MTKPESPSTDDIIKQAKAIEAAVQAATRRVLLEHKLLGRPVVICHGDEVRWVPAEEIQVPPEPTDV